MYYDYKLGCFLEQPEATKVLAYTQFLKDIEPCLTPESVFTARLTDYSSLIEALTTSGWNLSSPTEELIGKDYVGDFDGNIIAFKNEWSPWSALLGFRKDVTDPTKSYLALTIVAA